MQKGNYTEIEDDFRYAWFKTRIWNDLCYSVFAYFVFIRPNLESLSWCDRIGVLSWTSSARNSLYIWSWKHHYWGAIRIIYREFRANNVSNKSLIRLNHRSIILNWWYSPYYIIIYRIIGCFGVIWMNLILVIWIKQEKYCDIERAAGAPAQISRTKVRFKDFT
jgi:hypothetical protein